MASDAIAEILDTIRNENKENTEKFEKLLANMNNKLELIADDDEASDLIKLYITELKNVLEYNQTGVTNELNQIQNTLEISLANNENLVKNSDLEVLRYDVQENLNKYFFTLTEQNDKLTEQQTQLKQCIDDYDFQGNHDALKIALESVIETLKQINNNNPLNKLEELNQTTEKLSEKFAGITEIASSNIISDINSAKDIILSSARENSDVIRDYFEKLQDDYSKIVTEEDFINFKTYFAEFLQKILDNANILNLNSDVIKEQISAILEKIETLNYSNQLSNLSDEITDFKNTFEDNFKMNYQNIINHISDFKSELNSAIVEQNDTNSEKYSAISVLLSDLCNQIQILKDFSDAKSTDLLNEISTKLETAFESVKDGVNNINTLNINDIKNTISDISSELLQLKDEISQRQDTHIFAVSAGFDNVKEMFENLSASFENLNNMFESTSNANFENLTNSIHEVLAKTDELKTLLSDFAIESNEKTFSAVNEILAKLDSFSDSDHLSSSFNETKELISSEISKIQTAQDLYNQQLKETDELQTAKIENITENIANLDTRITEIAQGIKDYISELNNAGVSDEISQKLNDFGTTIEQNTNEYVDKIENLQNKLTEFVQIVENSSADTEGKIAISLEEISDVKEHLINLDKFLSDTSSNGKSEEILSLLKDGIGNIIQDIDSSNLSLKNGFDETFKNNLIIIEDKLGVLADSIQDIKSSEENNEILNNINERITTLKDEFGLINTDISTALQGKADEILKAFTDVKESLDTFSEVGFGMMIHELKSNLQSSFDNFTTNIDEKLDEKSKIVENTEQLYKNILEKTEAIEEYLSNNIQNSIELLNIAVQNCSAQIKLELEKNITEFVSDLKEFSKNEISILKQELTSGLASLESSQISRSDLTEEFENGFNRINDNLNTINTKIDDIAANDDSYEYFAKLDEISTSINNSEEEIINSISKETDNINDILSALHAKVDVLASSNEDFDLMDEIDDIKDLIFEQRKYFESVSDEKSEAIDNYLRDVLIKLDAVDTNKNTDDIKETIINALEALVSQISFVEETEDIKDFVEEKTDEINQNLIEVHNQLKQLVSSNDDFDYTYTLQDVESDIARLRLAINNLTGGDLPDFSDDIKKIVNTVETLENSLTQTQTAELKNDIEKLNEDIVSISSRTNKLLLTSDESNKTLNEGLNNFSEIITKLENRIDYLDNRELTEQIKVKIDEIHSMALESSNADKIFHQAMMYLGEWVDSITENITSTSDKIDEIKQVNENLEIIQDKLFDKTEIINELKEIIPENSEIIENIQRKFEQQDERISILEKKLDKMLLILEEKDDMLLNRKVDKIENLLSGLATNIEKLTSYVDEE